jgi:hypothetical protein
MPPPLFERAELQNTKINPKHTERRRSYFSLFLVSCVSSLRRNQVFSFCPSPSIQPSSFQQRRAALSISIISAGVQKMRERKQAERTQREISRIFSLLSLLHKSKKKNTE